MKWLQDTYKEAAMTDDNSSSTQDISRQSPSEAQDGMTPVPGKAHSRRTETLAGKWKPENAPTKETERPGGFNVAAQPASASFLEEGTPPAVSTTQDLLGWGLFWRFFFSQSGLLFLIAGIVCFFAFNWAGLPAFAKFGLIIAMILASLSLALLRGMDSSAGGLGLLACGLLTGPLVAVYGQVYQTGANASELFQVWAVLLLPLALISKRVSLWLCFWLVGSTWLILYQAEILRFGWDGWGADELWQTAFWLTQIVLMAQLAFWVLWEGSASFLASPPRGFLYSRSLPRLVCLFILALLTWQVCSQIIYSISYSHRYYREATAPLLYNFFGIAYVLILAFGGYWYARRRPDALILAMGMLSIIITVVFFIFSHEAMWNTSGTLFGAVMVIGASALAERMLRMHLKNSRAAREQWDERRREAATWLENSRAIRKKRQASVLPALANWNALQFALTSRLPEEEKKKYHKEEDASPWFVRILIGLCAWIALPLLLAFIGLFFFSVLSVDSLWPVFLFSLLCLGGSSALSKSGSLFMQQFGLALALASTVGIIASLGIEIRMATEDVFLLSIAVCAGGFFVVQNRAYKFGAALAVFLLLACWVSVRFMPSSSYYHYDADYTKADWIWLSTMHEIAGGIYYSILALFTVRLFFAPEAERKTAWSAPLRIALLTAFVCISLAILFRPLYMPISPANYMAGVGAGVGLGWYVIRALRPFHVAPATRAFFLAVAMAIAVASWRYPWLGAGFFCLALARRERSLPLVGLAAAFLAVAVNLEYYFLGTSLLMKSLFLCLTGIAFMGVSMAVSRLLASGIRARRLPAPLELLHAEALTEQGWAAGSPASDAHSPAPGAPSLPKERDTLFLLRQGTAATVMIIFLAGFGISVQGKEILLAEGTKMYLQIAPLDPRSLMQGDYMELDFAISRDIRNAEGAPGMDEKPVPAKRNAVVALDDAGVASFVRLAKEGEQLQAGEHLLRYKGWGWNTQVGSGSFFFQEGHGRFYDTAEFAEVRVDEHGTVLITHLLNAELRRIEPAENTEPAE